MNWGRGHRRKSRRREILLPSALPPPLHQSRALGSGKLLGQESKKNGGKATPNVVQCQTVHQGRRDSRTQVHPNLQQGWIGLLPPSSKTLPSACVYSRVLSVVPPVETNALPEQEGAQALRDPPPAPRGAAIAVATDPLNAVSPHSPRPGDAEWFTEGPRAADWS